MKNSKKDFSIAGQSTTKAKKSQKHDANLQKNSTLYFQIGLILCLLGTYALFEMQFQEKKFIIDEDDTAQTEPVKVDYPRFKLEVVEPKKVVEPPKEKPVKIIDKIKQVDDDTVVALKNLLTPDTSEPEFKTVDPNTIYDGGDKPKDIEDLVPFTLIEKVPVYPGCERHKTNDKRKKCMSEKITKLINRKFNTDIGSKYGLSGRQRINTQFTIDKNGNITDVKIRGPHDALEKEANRVINKIPQMEPGKQRNVPVGVIYTLPIMFDIRDY
jgi:protein TonB